MIELKKIYVKLCQTLEGSIPCESSIPCITKTVSMYNEEVNKNTMNIPSWIAENSIR